MMKKLLSLTFGLLFVLTSIAQSDGDYRSLTSGSWDEATTWEVYNDLSGTWEPAIVAPDESDAGQLIEIRATHIVLFPIPADVNINATLVIYNGGSLQAAQVTGTPTITINDLVVVEGEFTTEYLTTTVNVTINTGYIGIKSSGEFTVTGALVNTDVDRLIIKSDASGTGSLIHGSGAPAATVERFIPMDEWHFVSPSTTGVTPQNFYIDEDNSSWLTSWDETTQAWTYFVDPLDQDLSLGTGYSYWWEDSPAREMTVPGTIEFKGSLLDPTVDLVVTLSLTGTGDNSGFNLIGNPWPSAMELTPGLVGNLFNVEETVWIWNNSLNWYEWASTGDGSLPNTNPNEMSPTVVAVGQAVLMRAEVDGGTVTFDGDSRIHAPETVFWKNSQEGNESEAQLIELMLTKDDKTDRAYVAFDDYGSVGFENGFDVSKLFGDPLNSYIYLIEEEHNYARSFLSSLDESEERIVNVYVRAGSEGEHAFTVNMDYIPNTLVVLEDTETGTLTEMNNDVVYTFSAKPDDAENRFKLHFTSGVTGTENPGVQEDAVNIYAYNKAVYISNKDNSTYETAKVSIFDMYGREIYSTQSRLENNTRIPVNINNSYLIVRVTKGSNTYTEKVFVK